MKIRNSKFGWPALLLAGGCAQILGLSDYEVDPKLDRPSGGEGGEGSGEGGGKTSGGAGTSEGGEPTAAGGQGEGGAAVTGGGPGEGGTVGEGGAPPVGVLVPCDSAACCEAQDGTAVGVELLEDTSFELGPVGDGLTPWTQNTTTVGLELITIAGDGWVPRTGDYFAYLSGIANEVSVLWSEDVTVPADAGWLELSGYRLFQIDTEDEINLDYSTVNFFGYGASVDEYLFDWGAPSLSADGWGATPNWTRFVKSWDAVPHQGEIRYVAISGQSDDYTTSATRMASVYQFDDVSLKVFRCYK